MQHNQPLTTIYIYDEPDALGLDIADIGGFLAAQFPTVEILPRQDFFTHQMARFTDDQRSELEQEIARQLQHAQVTELPDDGADDAPDLTDLDLVFEASGYQAILRLLIDPEESDADHLHIVFTDNALGSWRDDDRAFRLHISSMGAPSIISTTGFVEALPRPREYHFKRTQFAMLGVEEDTLEDLTREFADRTFGYGDPRINEVCKGYALMACFYRAFGEEFCSDPSCRLHAATSQQEMIETQCGQNVGLCERHAAMLMAMREG